MPIDPTPTSPTARPSLMAILANAGVPPQEAAPPQAQDRYEPAPRLYHGTPARAAVQPTPLAEEARQARDLTLAGLAVSAVGGIGVALFAPAFPFLMAWIAFAALAAGVVMTAGGAYRWARASVLEWAVQTAEIEGHLRAR